MATVRILPQSYTLSNTNYLQISSASNMYNNTDNTSSYAQVAHNRANTTTYYLYIHNFKFNDVPTNARVSSFTVKIRALESGLSTNSSYRMSLYNGSTSISNTTCSSSLSTSSTVYTIPTGNLSWSTLSGYGNSFRIRVPLRRNSSNTSGYVRVYGAEILVEYTIPDPRTITSTLSGSGTISPSGSTTLYDGDSYSLTITPTDTSSAVTVTKNGTDITSSLEAHYTTTANSQTATAFTTQLSASGANFYTGSNTTGNYFNYAVGHTAASPGSTSTSYNTYVKDGGSNTATGYAEYSFDFSGLPSGAVIDSVQVQCYGACESTTYNSTHKAEVTLYSGTTLKSTAQNFTSTSNQTITISSPGTWTRSELQNAKLRFTVAYYGGRLFGITWTVNYRTSNNPDYYTYTYTVSGNATIAVVIGNAAPSDVIYYKNNGAWVEAVAVYKKVNGSWVLQDDLTTVFDSNTNYVKG